MRQRNIHIKNRLFALLSTVAAFSIVLGSIVQYHHHNSHGDIFLSVSLSADIGIGCHHGIGECHHDHDTGNCHDNDCAMHLDDLSLSRDDQSPDVFSIAIRVPCTTIEAASCRPYTISCIGKDCIIPSAPLKIPIQLRAPPQLG